jgi:hypothetical protein
MVITTDGLDATVYMGDNRWIEADLFIMEVIKKSKLLLKIPGLKYQ